MKGGGGGGGGRPQVSDDEKDGSEGEGNEEPEEEEFDSEEDEEIVDRPRKKKRTSGFILEEAGRECFIFFSGLSPSSRVTGIVWDFSLPLCPFHLDSTTLPISLLHKSFHLVFSSI